MNLLQLRASETCDFQDPEVDAVFDISRSIYGDLEGSDHRKKPGTRDIHFGERILSRKSKERDWIYISI